MMRLVAGCVLVLGAVACRPPVEPAPPPEVLQGENFEPTPLEPTEPANKAAGDSIELTIPGVEGEFIELESLRGKTVVLAIGGTTEAHWEAMLAWLEGVQEADPARRAAILVASDPEPDALDDVMSPVLLGWDPQGAVAARLSVARLPTVFVIDAEGQVVIVRPGFEAADRDALDAAL